MRNMKLTAVLAAVSALTLAGVGNSATPVAGLVEAQDFVSDADTLVGYPNFVPIGYYHRIAQTIHLPAVIPPNPNHPPNPNRPVCRALGQVWNIILKKVPEGPGRLNALTSVLNAMSSRQCCFDVTRDESAGTPTLDNPAPIMSIRPIACE